MGYNTNPLVYNAGVRPTWISDDRFWYRTTTADGPRFILMDAAKGTRAPAFDHAKVAVALSTEASKLPFQTIDMADDAKSFQFNNDGKRDGNAIPLETPAPQSGAREAQAEPTLHHPMALPSPLFATTTCGFATL